MRLYLVRHADALDLAPDAARPLSPRGREQVRGMAKFLSRTDAFEPSEIWHSTLVRARETANLLAERAKLEAPRVVVDDLEPEADPQLIARKLRSLKREVAIVGHEPHLGALATLLVTGQLERPAFVIKKGTVLALEREASHWLVRWQISPGLLG